MLLSLPRVVADLATICVTRKSREVDPLDNNELHVFVMATCKQKFIQKRQTILLRLTET